jgi:hypothetical protein
LEFKRAARIEQQLRPTSAVQTAMAQRNLAVLLTKCVGEQALRCITPSSLENEMIIQT